MTSRNQSLDVLRGVAVLMVIGRHLEYYSIWHNIGWIGVDLFFVLSGFLISGLLFQEFKTTGTINVRRFILRRGLKIWPAFYVFLFATAALWKIGTFGILFPAAFASNYFITPEVFWHTWSLSVEEHFYLLLPILVVFLAKKSRLHFIPYLLPAIAFGCLLFRMRAALPPEGTVVATHMRIDELYFGVVLGYFYHFKRRSFAQMRQIGIAVLCCSLPLFMRVETRVMETAGLLLLSIGFTLLVAWCVPMKPHWTLVPIATIGRFSYSIYLWHKPITLWLKGNSFLWFWTAMAVSLGVGILTAKLIEIPVLKLRDRWLSSNSILPVQVVLDRSDLGTGEYAVVNN